jgi:DNA polymerase-3 subunit epsilon
MPRRPGTDQIDLRQRRLAVISVHATGFNPNVDRIVEVAVVMRKDFAADRTYHRLVDPGIPILPQATEFHGVTDTDVSGAPTFDAIAPGLARFLGAADVAGFGVRRLAVPLLEAEFRRSEIYLDWFRRSIVDLCDIYLHHEPRHLGAAVGHYLGRDWSAHAGALAEAEASSQVLDAQLKKYEDLPTTAAGLEAYPFAHDPMGLFRRESGRCPVIFAEGRHRGRTPAEVARLDPDYLRSLLGPGLLFQARKFIEEALMAITPPGAVVPERLP